MHSEKEEFLYEIAGLEESLQKTGPMPRIRIREPEEDTRWDMPALTVTPILPSGPPGRHRKPRTPAPVIQAPPDDDEKYAYIKRALPYLLAIMVIGFLSITTSQVVMEYRIPATLMLVPFTLTYVIYQAMSLSANFTGRSFSLQRHLDLIAAWQPAVYPSVDIFLPVCGEPEVVLDNTWTYVSELIDAYPGIAIAHVLDDGEDPAVRTLAEVYQFNYIRRPNRGWFRKAGNLRYAFEHTDGEVIMILDADFAPRSDFLRELLPYMDDPDVAIVQSPQFFRTTPEQTWVERGGSVIQEVFYRSIQVARDRFDAAICVGSCALYRRSALEPHGGPALIDYAEDVHTGLSIHKDGKRLAYIPVNLATGISPDNTHNFVHQQIRWCTGNMFTVMLSRLWEVPMSFGARVSHIAGFGYYLSSAMAIFAIPLTPVILLACAPDTIKLSNLILFGPSLVTGLILYPAWHQGDYRLRDVLPLTIVRGWSHVLAIWDYARKHGVKWQPSGAKVKRVNRLWWGLVLWNGGVALTWLALTAWRIESTGSPRFIITIATGLLNAAVTIRAIYATR